MQEAASVVSFSDPRVGSAGPIRQGAGTTRTLRQAAMYKFEKKGESARPDPRVSRKQLAGHDGSNPERPVSRGS